MQVLLGRLIEERASSKETLLGTILSEIVIKLGAAKQVELRAATASLEE